MGKRLVQVFKNFIRTVCKYSIILTTSHSEKNYENATSELCKLNHEIARIEKSTFCALHWRIKVKKVAVNVFSVKP